MVLVDFFLDLFVCLVSLFERQSGCGGKGIKRFCHLLIYSPDGHNRQHWAMLKPGAKNFIQVPLMDGRDPNSWIIFSCCPESINRELNRKWSSQNSKWHSNVAWWHCKHWLNLPNTTAQHQPLTLSFKLKNLSIHLLILEP